MTPARSMGLPTLTHRPKTGLLERPWLWDTAAGPEPTGAETDVRVVDQLSGFAAAIVNVRWATTAVSLALAGAAIAEGDWLVTVAAVAVLGNTLHRTVKPLVYTGAPSGQVLLLLEVALFWIILAVTGFWRSPLVIASAAVLVVAGFAGGFRLALRIGAATTISLTIVGFAVTEWTPGRMSEAIQWTTLLLLTAVIAGYGRRISGEANRRTSAHLDRISQLTDANTLLFNLHRLAQTLPASLDQTEVLESSLVKLRALMEFDRAAIVLLDESDRTWNVARRQALDLADPVDPNELPEPAKRALATWHTLPQPAGGLDGTGAHPASVGGLYAPLTARDRLIGLVIIESSSAVYDERDRRALQGFIEPLALAIDNASWFGRLRRVSADEERSRIARELHDRIGQSLATLGFEVDRLVRHHDAGRDLGEGLRELREGVRSVTGEVRDALYDLRADVAEDKDFEYAIAEFAGRVAARSNLTVEIDSEAEARLPLVQEREMWRIAQEALINVERHAEASTVTIRWRCDERRARLEVIDDGRGMDVGRGGRIDSYGIVGMRERANSIGAAMEIISDREGTTVRCYLSQI